jgi:hypothetical protein
MCGIFGFIPSKKSRISFKDCLTVVKELALLSERRGMEAIGFCLRNSRSKGIKVHKESLSASKYIKSGKFEKLISENLLNCFEGSTILYDIVITGHTRIATNGNPGNINNQPVVKNNSVGVHNGIVCNVEELWLDHKNLNREFEVDTELLLGLLRERIDKGMSYDQTISEVFQEIEGYASICMVSSDIEEVLIATNCGSLYYITSPNGFLFASEELTLTELENKVDLKSILGNFEKKQLKSNTFGILRISDLSLEIRQVEKTIVQNCNPIFPKKIVTKEFYQILDDSPKENISVTNNVITTEIESLVQFNLEAIRKVKRCTVCLMPATYPFISFDSKGVCNYCKDIPALLKRAPLGKAKLEEKFESVRHIKEGPNCIVLLSGGRDSCYGLHYVVKELGLRPMAYSYDWGMLTDLGRRNQARMCGALGVEHIPISADIKQKRENIRKNVSAWLKKPHLGTVGLFMAGDKAFIHFAGLLRAQYNLPIIDSANAYEITTFKYGFAGVKPFSGLGVLSHSKKIQLMSFYAMQAITNPAYINSSIIDSVLAFRHYLTYKLNPINVYNYIGWDEKTIELVLLNEYNWELSPDTPTSWRIGDGTAALYNYIYYSVAGFSEHDCLRSNQIRMGKMTREDGLALIEKENYPRLPSLKWYCDIVGLDLKKVLTTVNNIPKLYSL